MLVILYAVVSLMNAPLIPVLAPSKTSKRDTRRLLPSVAFIHQRPRVDPFVCGNPLNLFHMYWRGSEVYRTAEWTYQVLLNLAYLDGTRYYNTPEFPGTFLNGSKSSEIHHLLRPLFEDRPLEKVGTDGDALALGMPILTCLSVDFLDEVDMRKPLPLQCEDGG